MSALDLFMIIPLAWGAFNGYRKGLLVEVVAVIAFIVAMIVGFKFLAFGIDLLSPYISRELARKLLPWLGFSVIFFPTIFLVNQMGFALRRSLKYTILGTFDSVAGAAVGLFTWLFGISVILWLLSYMGVKMPAKHTQNAFLYPYVVPVAPKIMDKAAVWVPKGLEAGKTFSDRLSN
ncbi:membrane protein required for colicin V production [Spirosoma lacussanchae]|uniref:CvpA family protein n=1 Tax=Spirosoma lacussanchae TaxID=1884249 RepID=UPI00148617B5|nr:CvpA family protein [Spirosoma lacussanchae]